MVSPDWPGYFEHFPCTSMMMMMMMMDITLALNDINLLTGLISKKEIT